MARVPLAAAGGTPDELEAEFYEALARGDVERLMAVWADDEDIVCVHPSGARAIGAAAVRASFEAMFTGGGLVVRPTQVHRMQHLGCELHHLVERIDLPAPEGPRVAWALATNTYVKTVQGWRLVSHHASPVDAQEPPAQPVEAPSTLH